jgi:acyl transferase domain-containing protein/thioesterase domain-containing protein
MTTNSDDFGQGIAVIGMSGRFPGASNLEEYWQVIVSGQDTITRGDAIRIPAPLGPNAPDPSTYVAARGVLANVEDFDPGFFGFTPAEAARVDPQHRLWIELAFEALEQAGYAHDRHTQIVSVFAGSFLSSYLYGHLLPTRSSLEEFFRLQRTQGFALMVQNDPAFLPSRSAYTLGLRGPAVNVQTGCSTSLVAVAQAVQSLLSGESDIALAGGVCIALPQDSGYYQQEGAMSSRDGFCRPYDAQACGTVFGSGGGAVALKRLADAERDGDPIWAVLRGAAINNDGHSKTSFVAPSVTGQAEVITTALTLAGVEPDSMGYVEGHGTATPMGDPIEVEALTQAFRRQNADKGFCCLGSVKGNVGHLDAAAGVAGFIRAVLALHHRTLPPTAHFTAPNPELRLADSPFYVLSEARTWPQGPQPRRAGVSSFGIGGTNAHVVLEEFARKPQPASPVATPITLHLSAKDDTALDRATANLRAFFEKRRIASAESLDLAAVAATLKHRRQPFAKRRTVCAASIDDSIHALQSPGRWDTGTALTSRPKLFFAFPGQGSLRTDVLASLLAQDPPFKVALAQLAQPASDLLGFDVMGFCSSPDGNTEAVQKDNAKSQVILFCVCVALARCVRDRGVRPDATFGHSLGEWPAAHLSGLLSAEDALAAVFHRGRLMSSTGKGSVLSVHLGEVDLLPLLLPGVTLACVNGPSLCSVSGRPDAIAELDGILSARAIPHREIPIDVAVHSPAMDPAVAAFSEILARLDWHAPTIPMLSSVTGSWLPSDPVANQTYFAQQLRSQVRFDRVLQFLSREPACLALEVGIGSTMTTLISASLSDGSRHCAISLTAPGQSGGELTYTLDRIAGRLWTRGLTLDATRNKPAFVSVLDLPSYPFTRRRCWVNPPMPSHAVATDLPPPSDADNSPHAADRISSLIREMSGLPAEALDRCKPFSELGLESLFLVQLAERLAISTAAPINYARLSEHNTIERLAQYIEKFQTNSSSSRQAERAAKTPTPESTDFRGLITLQKGDGILPFLLVHGDQANDLLPRYLPAEQSLWGYAHQGADGEAIRLRGVEELAAHCLSEWTAIHGDAPCVLGGHSYGGHVAYHVAHLLQKRGVRVAQLFLVDVIHPRVFRHLYGFGPKWLWTMSKIGWGHIENLARIGEAETYLRRSERVPAALRTPYILSTYELSVLRYFPPKLDVETTLFVAANNVCDLRDNGYTRQGVPNLDAIRVQGGHLSVVRNERVFKPIAEVIRERVAHWRH